MSMDNLWAPWRMAYLKQLDAEGAAARPEAEPGCFLCESLETQPPDEPARQRLVLLNDPRGVVLLNRYPYTSGHLLAAPCDHVGTLADLSPQARADLMELTALGERLLKTAFNAQGINVGLNLGRSAGAGLPGHLHVHLVPRWHGDTNFMTTVGNVRVIPQALEESYQALRAAMAKET